MRVGMPFVLVFHVVLVNANSRLQAQPSSGRELLEFALAAHQTSREQIQTLTCSVSYDFQQFEPPQSQPGSGRYWYSRDAIRLTAEDEYLGQKESTDFVCKQGIYKGVTRKRSSHGEEQVGANLSASTDRHFHRLDPFTLGCLNVQLPGSIRDVPLATLIAAGKLDRADWTDLENQKCVLIQLSWEKGPHPTLPAVVELYLDPALNYLCRKTVLRFGDYARREYLATEFKEFPGGVFFPIRIEQKLSQSGKPWGKSQAVISELKINVPLPTGIFELAFPNGIYVTDLIRNETYQADASGRRLGQTRPISSGKFTPPPDVQSDIQPVVGEPTKAEPRSVTRWILPVSCAVLLVGIILHYLRGLRSRRQSVT